MRGKDQPSRSDSGGGRKKRAGRALLAVIVALLVLPVLAAQLSSSEPRRLEGVSLEDTTYREIAFRNDGQDLDLAGMLFVPDAQGPFPAAVVIHGSGTSRRDSFWYLTLTQYLQESGIAVLLPDKRGSEQSEGDWRTASFEDLATDTEAAIAFLRQQDEVGVSTVGVIGMSQGGHIAPIVATRSSDLAFLVNVVGAAVPMHEQLVYEEKHNLRESGVPPGIADALAQGTSALIRNQKDPEFWNAIGNFDPLPYWEQITTPSLILYGENDTNVPSAESAARLRSLDKPNITVRIYEGSGHALEDPEGEGNSVFRQEALEDIRDFIDSASATS